MGGERSTVTETLISRGMAADSCGSRPRIRSTVSMMLAPGDRKMTTITAVLPFTKPSVRTSSTESTTSPRSLSCTGAPLRKATIRSRYSAALKS